jgi:GNAT superfamily N-acetyltransferase
MENGMALGATKATDLEELHRAALAEQGRVVLVAERDGELVGMAHLEPSRAANATHRAEVQRVAVAADARGSGVGRQLMTALEEEARARGLTLLWLTTHAGTEAAWFYEAIGYTELGAMPNYSRRPDGTLWPGAFYYRELAPGGQRSPSL